MTTSDATIVYLQFYLFATVPTIVFALSACSLASNPIFEFQRAVYLCLLCQADVHMQFAQTSASVALLTNTRGASQGKFAQIISATKPTVEREPSPFAFYLRHYQKNPPSGGLELCQRRIPDLRWRR